MKVVEHQDDRIGPWISEGIDYQWVEGNVCFGVEDDDGILAAGVMVAEWNGSNATLHIRVADPQAMGRAFLKRVFSYVFDELGAKRVTAPALLSNLRGIRLCLKVGFVIECVLRDYFPDDGLVIMGIWRETCIYLENDNG
jgi:RimJ/RimL family protein N-acetyltransferase